MEPIVCPETSVRNCHYSLRNSTEEGNSQEKFMIIYRPSTWVPLFITQVTQSHSVSMFATAYISISPPLDFRGFMQDVSCATPMPTALRELHQRIAQAINREGRDMLQRMWEGLKLPFEYTEGIQWQSLNIAPFVQTVSCHWDFLYFLTLNRTTDFGSLCTCTVRWENRCAFRLS
jgi:hypothetical protein